MKRILNPTDQNTLNLLNNYTMTNGRNYDVLIKIENDNITAKTFEQILTDDTIKISRELYFNTYCFPWINNKNLQDTMFLEWRAPSFYDKFQIENNKITIEKLDANTIPLNDYIKIAQDTVEKNIKNFLDTSTDVLLLYSGGIDSLLLLSYLIKYDRIKDTRLLYYYTDTDEKNTFSYEKNSLGMNIEYFNITENDLYEQINNLDPFKFRECLTYIFLNKFKDTAMLNGNEGNSVLFHKWEWTKRLGKLPKIQKPMYVESCNKINWNIPTDLNHATISLIEPYSRSWNNPDLKNIIAPISDLSLMKMLPFVDIRDMSPEFVPQATMVKNMIYNNVGNMLDKLIVKETETWFRPIIKYKFKIDKIDPKIINIDYRSKKIKKHDLLGLSQFYKTLKNSIKNNEIDLGSILVLKYINYFL